MLSVGRIQFCSVEIHYFLSFFREGLDVLGQSADLYVGRELKGTWSDKDKGMSFYRMTVDAEDILNGFFVFCRSEQRHMFKLVLSDADGKVMYAEDSQRNCSEAIMYFTNFDTYALKPVFRLEGSGCTPVPGSSLVDNAPGKPAVQYGVPAHDCDSALGVFNALDGVKSSRKALPPGKYLLCVLNTAGSAVSLSGRGGFTISMAIATTSKDAVVRAFVCRNTPCLLRC